MNSDLHLIGQHNALLGDVTLLGKEVNSVVSVKRMTRAAGFFSHKAIVYVSEHGLEGSLLETRRES